ncbi:MAG: hypothetical protein Q7T97_02445 [Burkholderiaceae bacterium]|nr:hypothetical protein [Burkholderiaceae bacterium]
MTPAQLQTLKAAINADPVLLAFPNNSDGAFAIAAAVNLPASPAVNVWRTEAPVADIIDAINWAQYTPVDVVDATSIYTNRLLAIQTKQMNLQMNLQGRESVNASKVNIRAGLRDAVIAVPAGAGGAAVSPGGASGVNVLNACVRNALRVEAILAGADATTGTVTAKLLVFEGSVNYQDIEAARAS